ncbi:MAG: glycosyltransferase family 2 protein [Bacteroidota bacterium]
MVKPKRIYIIADGAKDLEDTKKVSDVRSIVDNISWACDVRRNFSENNLGCRKRMSSGLDWVFDQEDEAIILEDDCHPSLDFFNYCQTLLDFHRTDNEVGAICGSNFQQNRKRGGKHGYYFSRFPAVWGWATWKRAWKGYDVDMKDWLQWEGNGGLIRMLPDEWSRKHWKQFLGKTSRGNIDTWDFQFVFHCWKNGMLSAISDVNLVSNHGFRDDATHTKHNSKWANMATDQLCSLIKQENFIPHNGADAYTMDYHFGRAKKIPVPNNPWHMLMDRITNGSNRWKNI